MLVEVQLHLRSLVELKHDLHTLYTGVRVLSMADDAVVLHHGDLTSDAIDRAHRGITPEASLQLLASRRCRCPRRIASIDCMQLARPPTRRSARHGSECERRQPPSRLEA